MWARGKGPDRCERVNQPPSAPGETLKDPGETVQLRKSDMETITNAKRLTDEKCQLNKEKINYIIDRTDLADAR